jgi:hypothetical protein
MTRSADHDRYGSFAESGHGILTGMSTRPRSQAGEPKTLGNIRANGVRSLADSSWQCHQPGNVKAVWSEGRFPFIEKQQPG